MPKLTLEDLSLKGKHVLMRVDFNVPLDHGKITDDSRIRAALPSIEYVLNHGAALILMSHLGRPKAKPEAEFSLSPCAKRLSELLKKPVFMAKDCIGPEVEKMASQLTLGQVLLLENLRFHPGEEFPEKDPSFAANLAKLGDCYINDAFGTAHRAHSSTAAITHFFPENSAMGFLMEKEIKELSPLLNKPQKPFYAIIGGAKISSKIGVIKKLLEKVDALFIGGGMVYTFMKERGIEIGASISEDPSSIQGLPSDKLHFPVDLVIANQLSNSAQQRTVLFNEGIPKGWQGVDIGPKTVIEWSKQLQKAATIFWNGPLGVFEISNFAKGTEAIAKLLAHSNANTIVGGGDSVAAIEQMGLADRFAHLSTGGGASLEFLEQGRLPGIDALTDK
jgi:phosphoglycerate kinase